MLRTCPSCGRTNRVANSRLASSLRCGACKAMLPPLAEPIDADPELQAVFKDLHPNLVAAYSTYPHKSENYYGFPQMPDVLINYYRKDVFCHADEQAAFQAKYGKKLPCTPEEMNDVDWDTWGQFGEFFQRKAGDKLAGETLTDDFFGITYQAGNKLRLNPSFKSRYSDLDAMPREFLDRWVLPGDEEFTNVPSIVDPIELTRLNAVYPYNNYNYSTERVADGSFVRLRTVSLSYLLPSSLWGSSVFKSASLTLTGTNLMLLYSDKKLYGQDPEFFASGGVALPVARQITASLKVTF